MAMKRSMKKAMKAAKKAMKARSMKKAMKSMKRRAMKVSIVATNKLAKLSVKKGDTVVYSKYAGNEVEIKGESHLIVRESELLGVIEG